MSIDVVFQDLGIQYDLTLNHVDEKLGAAVSHKTQNRVLEGVVGIEELGQFTLRIAGEDAEDERADGASADDAREQVLLVQCLDNTEVESAKGRTTG